MRSLPMTDPGVPDLRSPGRFLLRVAASQRWTVLGGVLFGVVCIGGQALVPYVLGRAVDEGVAANDGDALVATGAEPADDASDPDRVAVVEDGRVSELGSHAELLALGGSYAALWASWQSAGTSAARR